jgi:hypothetical protein
MDGAAQHEFLVPKATILKDSPAFEIVETILGDLSPV